VLRERRAPSIVLLAFFVALAHPARAEEAPPQAPSEAPDTWGAPAAQSAAPSEETEPAPNPEPAAPTAPVGQPSGAESAEPRALRSCTDCSPGRAPDEASVRYTLEGVEVRGNTRTSTRVILRYVRFKAGDLLDVDDPEVELTRFRLLGTGFFRDVQFSLRKGSERGRVVLVVEVVERNTIVVNDIAMGLAADADAEGRARRLSAYAGLDIAETNLGGTGITLGGAAAVGGGQPNLAPQIALRVRFLDPAFLGGPWMTSGVLLFNDAQDSFGYGRQKWNHPGGLEVADGPAIVRYKRFGGSLGVGRDLSISTQFWATYRLETIDANLPLAASQFRGFLEEPVDFHVVRGRSVLSTLSGTLQLDTRDHPFLPTRGWFVSFRGELSLLPAALDYDYQKFEFDASHWWKLPFHDHVLKLGVFAGGISGHAPFFEQFYVGDYSDLLPDRVLGMNFDRRPAPNFLGTDIVEVRYGDYALKLSAEYRIPIYRGRRSIYGIDLFATTGIYGVAGRRDLTEPPPGYSGLARIPLDLTANVGLRMNTSAGGFAFAFSNVLSFVPVRGQGPAGH
jgi:outer membrane protein assembly factor BamA